MPAFNNATCTRCNKRISHTANYCEHCGCCFDSQKGLRHLGLNLLLILGAFLIGVGICSYNLNSKRAALEANALSLPTPAPTAAVKELVTATPTPSESPQASPTTQEGAEDDKKERGANEEATQEKPAVSQAEFLRQKEELRAAQEALTNLQRFVNERMAQSHENTSSRPRMVRVDEDTQRPLSPQNRTEPSAKPTPQSPKP